MRAYVGVTDNRWFNFLARQKFDEVNFWRPGGRGSFRVLEPGELFLFKLHSPLNYIVGGGWFVRFSHLPTFLAWEAFGQKNGTETFVEFEQRITRYRGASLDAQAQIGCIILASPFFFSQDEWIPVPEDWKPNIVQGKTYDDSTSEGRTLLDQVLRQISKGSYAEEVGETAPYERGRVGILRPGQGAFRIMVTDAYNRRCAISGERTLPVL
ncbi:MAG: HNH endonuclease, partial [Spirochaetales bacterium]|nr:HNH endonuclease [Spirochaetales bacterium]